MVVEKAAFGRYCGNQYSVNNNGRGVMRIDTSDNDNIKKRYTEFGGVGLSLTGPEVWRQGWRQFMARSLQATVTSPLERFIY